MFVSADVYGSEILVLVKNIFGSHEKEIDESASTGIPNCVKP